jgi:hypothetical protein
MLRNVGTQDYLQLWLERAKPMCPSKRGHAAPPCLRCSLREFGLASIHASRHAQMHRPVGSFQDIARAERRIN